MDSDSFTEVHSYGWREIRSRFWPLIHPHLLKASIAGILVGAVGLAVALQPLFAKYVIDEAIPRKSLPLAIAAAGVFIFIMFTRMSLWFWAMTMVYRIQQAIVFELRATSFAHLQKLCLRFHSQFPSGFLYERVFGNSINMLGNFMQVLFSRLITYIAGLLFSLGFCLYLSPLLTFVIMTGAISYVIAARMLSHRIYKKTRESNEAGMRIVNVIMDKLRGHKTIQSFGIEDRVQDEFTRQLRPAMEKWLASVLESMKLGFVTEGISYVITASVIVGGAWLVIRDTTDFSLGTMIAFMGYQGTFISMITAVTQVYGQFMNAKTAFDQLFTVLDTHSTLVEKPNAVMPENFQPRLEFKNVSFTYADTPALQNVNLEIPAYRTMALVGRSGSGKSTLANLMIRFYDPSSGAILLDGHDLRDLPLRKYRDLFGVVLQDPFLFDTTIEANMRAIQPGISESDLKQVLEKAGALEFIEKLPGKLKYQVGEGGNRLSGGQRQRLAIARCMLSQSRFVILDEATSALDVESEQYVRKGLEAICQNRTVIIVAHRLSTIRHADTIVVMEQGHVEEQGTFDELLTRGGLFARLHTIATSTSTQQLKLKEAGFA